jgi:hypothetical protein
MKFSSFSRSEEGLIITLHNDIPVENVGEIKYYNDNSSGIFSKKEFRWSFNNESWSAWEPLTQGGISRINTFSNYYLFLEIRYVLSASGSGSVTTFTIDYLEGDAIPYTPRIFTSDIQRQDASSVLIHDILQKYEVTNLLDASLLNGYAGIYYLNRTHHYGTQPITTITGLQNILTGITRDYLAESSLGSDFNWNNGYLDVSTATGFTGTFTSDGSTVTVKNGLIISVI